jgi:2-keto-4-pentenoate hydratase
LKPAAVFAAANRAGDKLKRGQICEANFYCGELALQAGMKAEARYGSTPPGDRGGSR